MYLVLLGSWFLVLGSWFLVLFYYTSYCILVFKKKFISKKSMMSFDMCDGLSFGKKNKDLRAARTHGA
jgi:hypothetical protein